MLFVLSSLRIILVRSFNFANVFVGLGMLLCDSGFAETCDCSISTA